MSCTELNTWQELQAHRREIEEHTLNTLFAAENDRFTQFSLRFEDILVDYSKHCINQQTLYLLLQLARDADLLRWIESMFRGDTVNDSEQRPALHIALRRPENMSLTVAGRNVVEDVHAVLRRMGLFAEQVRNGQWRGYSGERIRDVVNIGIGGSDLGPRLACEALSPYAHDGLRLHFASSVDAAHLHAVLDQCDPERTLFIVASKSFTTQETMTNARTAREWLIAALGEDAAVARHFVAVSTNASAVQQFGIDTHAMFGFWDWVGGRYSLWSAIGLPVMIAVGRERFAELLAGAHAMDEHFRNSPLDSNLPVLLGLLGIWYNNFLGLSTHALLVYDEHLRSLPNWLQQLDMESNGKSVDRAGQAMDCATGPVIWGGLGINGQHAFYQSLHQGTQRVPVDFLAPACSQRPIGEHHDIMLANAFAQARALMTGRSAAEARAELQQQGLEGDALERLLPYKVFPGNRPSTFILYQRLTPRTLGSLLALYEHKVFVQSVVWNINPFDQWGVELGKQMARQLLPQVCGDQPPSAEDGSTQGLLQALQQMR